MVKKTGERGEPDRLPSGRWRARFTDPAGKRHSKTFATKTDAAAWKQSQLRAIELGVWQDAETQAKEDARRAITVKDLFETLPAKRSWETSTERGQRSKFTIYIEPTFGNRAVVDVTRADILEWWDDLLQGKPKTKVKRDSYMILHTIFAQAVEDELIEANPCRVHGAAKRPAKKKEAHIPTSDELTRVLAEMPPHFRCAILVASGCALRIGEWTELRRKDLVTTGEAWKLHISRQVRDGDKGQDKQVVAYTKTKRDRWVTVPSHVVPHLQAHMARFVAPGRESLLFPNQRGTWTDRRRFNRLLKHACEVAGVEPFTSHSLRHYGGTEFARAGGTLAEIMGRLGHTSTETALTYQHAVMERDVQVADRMALPDIDVDLITGGQGD